MAQDQLQSKQQRGQHKRQVRRRLHTTRPYQERLLNMAEARKEIVTALKFHRDSMKQQQQQQKQAAAAEAEEKRQQTPPISPPPPPLSTNHHHHHSFYTNSAAPPSYPMLPTTSILPDQTLGLNLNFQGFTDMDASILYTNHTTTPSSFSSILPFSPSQLSPSSLSSSSSASPPFDPNSNSLFFFNPLDNYHGDDASLLPPPPFQTIIPDQAHDETNITIIHEQPTTETSSTHQFSQFGELDLGFHPRGLDDEQMEEIRLIGNRHQIEWNDTLSLVNSAWWSKFLNTMESDDTVVCATNGLKENIDIGSPSLDDQFGSSHHVMEPSSSMPYGCPGTTDQYYPPPGTSLSTTSLELPPCVNIHGYEQGLDEEYWLS